MTNPCQGHAAESAWAEHMKEAERLIDDLVRAGTAGDEHGTQMVPVHCTPTEHEGRIVYEHTSEPIPNADGFVLYAASADQFRTAAKMMAEPAGDHIAAAIHYPECWDTAAYPTAESALAEVFAHYRCTEHDAPAEVPMPEPVAYGFGNTAITGHTNRLMMVRLDVPLDDQYAGAFWLPLVLADEAQQYGAACRAAGEAAGYARGVRGERDECAALCRNIYSWPGAYYAGPMDTATLKAAASAIEARSGPKVGKRAALRGEVKP